MPILLINIKQSKVLCLIILLALPLSVYSQNIKGTVNDVNGKGLNATILFKEFSEQNLIKEFAVSRNGTFNFSLKKNYTTLLVEVKAEGYKIESELIENPEKSKSYLLNFTLIKDSIQLLDEVTVTAPERPFEIKKDTTSYKVTFYSNGSEQKIVSVIKKLPGIEVNDISGQIKFKGKPIETVLLDGTDLFGRNYTVGTKNINIDVVEEIEAIEKYSENPLLKGIEDSDKIVLNLKLKENILNFSGNVDNESGLFENGNAAQNANSTLLAITKEYKSFATLSYNNIGINNSPFEYSTTNINLEDFNLAKYQPTRIIPEFTQNNIFSQNRGNINSAFFGSYNASFNLGNKANSKLNLFYINDNINIEQLLLSSYNIGDANFQTSDESTTQKSPQQYRLNFELKHKSSYNSLLEYDLKAKREIIKTTNSVLQNNRINYLTRLKSDEFNFFNHLRWTKKIKKLKVLQFSFLSSISSLPQNLTISPSITETGFETDLQQSRFEKMNLDVAVRLFGKNNDDKYKVELGNLIEESPFISSLQNIDTDNVIFDQKNLNDGVFKTASLYNISEYTFNRGKWKVSPKYTLTFLSRKLTNNINSTLDNESDYIFEPELSSTYLINRISSVSIIAKYTQSAIKEQFLFQNPILLGSRVSVNNTPSLELQKNQLYSISYTNNDLYNQLQINAFISYQKVNGNIFSNLDLDENTSQIQYFYLPENTSDINASLIISKYIPFIESTLKLTSNFSLSKYKSNINETGLLNNTSQLMSNSLFFKSAFDLPLNFENTFTWRQIDFKRDFQANNVFNSIEEILKINFKIQDKYILTFSNEFYVPNLKQSNNFLFSDMIFKYTTKKDIFNLGLSINNLWNTDNFEQIQANEVSSFVYRSNLLSRHFLLHFSWSF